MIANLFIVVAPSGAGKTSLVRALITQVPALQISISHTTRPVRPAEVHGIDYFFVSESAFRSTIEQGLFLEYATVHGSFYGTSKEWVLEQLQQGIDVILEIDWQGARQILQQFPKAVSIFILPPSFETLEHRLRARAQDSEAVIHRRLAAAREELRHYYEFKYLLVNDVFAEALDGLVAIVKAERQLCERQAQCQRERLAYLLNP